MRISLLRRNAFDTRALQDQLKQAPWDEIRHRTSHPESPHREVSDIWVRYNPLENFKGDMRAFNEAHEAKWYPVAECLSEAVHMANALMAELQGVSLGAVLVTKIPPHKQVYPHIDQGWHARNFEKFAIQVQGNAQQCFLYDDDHLVTETGDLFWFDNAYTHSVINDSDEDRVTLIVCIRRY